jgi:hypothetical protein
MANVIRDKDGVLIRAPHLSKYDHKIVQQYFDEIVRHPYEAVFDLRCPPEIINGPGGVKEDTALWTNLVAKRIDLVIKKPTVHYVCEAKPQASAMAIGQVQMYKDLYQKYYKPDVPVIMLILTDTIDPAVVDLCNKTKIVYYETNKIQNKE